MKTLKLIPYVLFAIIGSALAFLLNIFILEPLLIIPDYCYYDTREPGFLINLFYDFPGSEGYHPVPSRLNILLTIVIGAFAGYKSFSLLQKSVKATVATAKAEDYL